eukprot:2854299-Amphidinium_carterae.1
MAGAAAAVDPHWSIEGGGSPSATDPSASPPLPPERATAAIVGSPEPDGPYSEYYEDSGDGMWKMQIVFQSIPRDELRSLLSGADLEDTPSEFGIAFGKR